MACPWRLGSKKSLTGLGRVKSVGVRRHGIQTHGAIESRRVRLRPFAGATPQHALNGERTRRQVLEVDRHREHLVDAGFGRSRQHERGRCNMDVLLVDRGRYPTGYALPSRSFHRAWAATISPAAPIAAFSTAKRSSG